VDGLIQAFSLVFVGVREGDGFICWYARWVAEK
jgi:hypothetical protein